MKIKRLLVANRGEIAIRIIRAARQLGIESVLACSEVDSGTIPSRIADKTICIGKSRAQESYLDIKKLVNAAIQTNCEAVHPGYGFLSENPEFAREVSKAGLIYVGPSWEAIEKMGDKEFARNTVSQMGVPILPGIPTEAGLDKIKSLGFPLLVKAVSGGSGRGMRRVESEDQLEIAIEEAAREAKAAFSDDRLIVEKYLNSPRHIEVQIFGDSQGNIIHLGERECSIQRRHQKLVEEAPAINLHKNVKDNLYKYAILAAKSVNYQSAGTVEFLVESGKKPDSPIWFLEMNTRIQVEHPVTEEVWNKDLLCLQLEIASGKKIPFTQSDLSESGHAIELRVYAEDIENNFSAKTGKVTYYSRVSGAGVREDGWIETGTEVSAFYDSLLSKIIVKGSDRNQAIRRIKSLLSETVLEGIPTTLGFYRWLINQEDFLKGNVNIHWLENNYKGENPSGPGYGPLVIE